MEEEQNSNRGSRIPKSAFLCHDSIRYAVSAGQLCCLGQTSKYCIRCHPRQNTSQRAEPQDPPLLVGIGLRGFVPNKLPIGIAYVTLLLLAILNRRFSRRFGS